PVEDVSIRIAKDWGVGGQESRGVLILAAIGDRKARIEAGYGVEGFLPDGLTGEILDDDVVPRFRKGDLSGGLRAGAERIAALTAQEYGLTITRLPRQSRFAGSAARVWRPLLPFLFFLPIFIIMLVLRLRGYRRRPINPLFALLLLGGGRNRRRGGFWGDGGS